MVTALFAQKGGAGKSTLALHLAVEAGHAVIADLDQQGSASGWSRIRESTPAVFPVEPRDTAAFLASAKEDGIPNVFLDFPPHARLDVGASLAKADLIVVPIRPSVLDIMALDATAELVRASKVPAIAVLSAVPTRSADADEIEQYLLKAGWTIAPVRAGFWALGQTSLGPRVNLLKASHI